MREKDIPYMTQEWKKALRMKRKYAKMFSKDRTAENLELKKKYRNIATRERRKAIRAYWYSKTEEHKSRPDKFYDTFKPFISNKSKDSVAIHLNSETDNKVVQDQKEVAEMLASYFTNAALSIGGDHVINLTEQDHNNHSSVRTIQEVYKETNFEFSFFTTAEVQKVLENINPKKSGGWDTGITPKLLKNVAKGTAASLTSLYNSCIGQNEWPNTWKRGEWTAVFKKGDRHDAKSYRPITSLTAVNKIFEQLLSNQMTSHFDKSLYHRMTAYRKGHSCETALLGLIEDWKLTVDKKQLVSVLSTDMSKAFDSLSHSLTIKKLEAYGFGNHSLNLMRSFFKNRQNRVRLVDVTSDWVRMKRGCTQGSAFEPLLWNLFQNDLSSHVTDGYLNMYADDHQVYVKGQDHEETGHSLKNLGEQTLSWYSKNFLLANPEKFQSMNINPRKLDKEKSDITLNIHDLNIVKAKQIKLLGVTIDDDLNFTEHIKEISTKASKKVGVLNRLRNLIPCRAKLLLYKCFIMPHLTYCHLVWHFCKNSDYRKLERLQERALRTVYRSHSASYEELLGRAKLPTLYNRRLQDTAVLMYKVKCGLTPTCISDLFARKNSTYALRKSDFELTRFNTIRYGKHSIRYMGPFLWSKLPKDLKESPNVTTFRNKIRKLDLSGYLSNNSNCCNLCGQ